MQNVGWCVRYQRGYVGHMRRTLILVPLALSAALLTGCAPGFASMSGGSTSDSSLRGPAGASESLIGGDTTTFGPAEDKAMNVVGPQIITTVDLTVTVTKPLTAADDASKIAGKFGGSVSYRSESSATADSPGSAQLTLRIPSGKLTQALDELKELGIARDTSINALDVTAESTDLDARITSLQTSVDRLLTLMSQATSTENLLAVESALSQRQADLESLQAQKRNLDDQVQLSTVNLYLEAEANAPVPNPDNFWTGLVSGWNAFVGFWAGALVVLGVLVPWLAAAGLIALIVIVWVKRARRRRAATRAANPASFSPYAAAPGTAAAQGAAEPGTAAAHDAVGVEAVAPSTPAPTASVSTVPAPTKSAPKKPGKA